MTAPLLSVSDIHKRFGHAHVLKGVDFSVYPAEICALIGDNGAGKSTLVKILSGAEKPTRGAITIDGAPLSLSSPAQAQRQGIATVYQDLALAPELTPSDNLFLGSELLKPGILGRFGILDRSEMRRRAGEQFAKLGVRLRSAKVPVSSLSGGQRQSVAIARAAMWANRVIFMDEPTAALGVVQTQRVLELIRQVKSAGISVVLISHNMLQVLEIADRIVVLRLGQNVAEFRAGEATVQSLVAAMTSGTATSGRAAQ